MTPMFSRRALLSATSALAASSALPRLAWSVQGDTLRYAMARDIAILDPAFYVAGEDVILDCVLPTLTQYVRAGTTETQPYVAESVAYVDDTTLEFTLHEGLVWTNGYGPVTAADVKFSFERVIDPAVDSPYAEGWTTLDHVEVIDDRTGRLILNAPDPTMWLKLSAYNGHFHCAQAVADAGGKWTTELPAGCGPYVIADWQPNQRLVLEHNPDFRLFEPTFKRIEVYPIEDEKTSELAFEAGEVDYTRIAVASIPRYRETPPDDGHLYEAPETRYAWIGMNTQHPNLQDIRVRQAIQYAADVDAILEGAYNGVAPRATGMITPQMVGARDANLIAGRDLDKARQLLAEAGLPDGFATTITVMNTAEFVAAAQILQASLAEVGIEAEVLPYDSAVYWNLGLETEGEDWKDLQITFMRFGGSLNGYDILKWLAPDQVGIWNWERHDDPEMGELLKAAQIELDDETRAAMFRRIQDIMELSGAYIFLTHGAAASIYRDGLDIAMRPDFVPQLRRFEKT